MKKGLKSIGGLMFVIGGILLTACSSDPNSPGLEYMPDMYRSAAIEPYVDYGQIKERENPELKEMLSAKTPPSNTIPYYGTDSAEVVVMMPYSRLPLKEMEATHGLFGWETSDTNEYELAINDVNPYTLTAANQEGIFKSGKKIYTAMCMHCHGEAGDGKGPMMKNGVFSGVPDYANKKELSDGQMFYSIYYGKGAMGAHGPILNKKEIWTLIHYIRKFQDDKYGASEEVEVEVEAPSQEGPAQEAGEQ